MELGPLIEGKLLRRYKRFLADVELVDGSMVTVHCPNTGAMTGCAEAGSRVWLSTSTVKTRKYPYTWELVETVSGLACIHSSLANGVVREAIETGKVPGFEAWPSIRTEVKFAAGSRVDLLLDGPPGRVYIEVKSVTLCGQAGQGLFPDAVSQRGRKHLQALQSVCGEKDRAVLFFCVFHQGISKVSVAGDIDPQYREAMLEALAAGVEVQVWRAAIDPGGITLERPLCFSVDPPAGALCR